MQYLSHLLDWKSCSTAEVSTAKSLECALAHLQLGQQYVESLFEVLEHLSQREEENGIELLSQQREDSSATCSRSIMEACEVAELASSLSLFVSLQDKSAYSLTTWIFQSAQESLLNLTHILQSLEAIVVPTLHLRQLSAQQVASHPIFEAKARLLYLIFKAFDLHAAVARRQQWPTERRIQALGEAIATLGALGTFLNSSNARDGVCTDSEQTARLEAEEEDVSLPLLASLTHLGSNAKEEAAMNLVELMTLTSGDVAPPRLWTLASPHEEALEEWREWEESLEAALNISLRRSEIFVHINLVERREMAAMALRLLKDAWGGRVMPANIDLHVRILEAQLQTLRK